MPFIDNENIVSTYEGNSNLLWADRYGKQLRVEDLWVKQCGNSHTGSFKDLGMTVLVSVVKQMMADGEPIDAVACASTGDTSAALGAYCAAAGHPLGGAAAQEQGLDRRSSCSRWPTARSCSRSTPTSTAAWRWCRRSPRSSAIYLANSMNSLRIEGQKTVAIEIVQQFDWEVPDWVVIPGGNLGNVHALGQGFLMMQELGLIQKLPRICLAQAERANPLYRSFLNDFETFEPITARADAGQRDPDRQPGQRQARRSARCSASTASSSRPASRSWPTRRRAPTAPACSTARTPAWRWPRCASWSSARSSARTSAWSSSRRRTGSSSPTRRRPTTWGRCAGIKPTYRNKPRRAAPTDARSRDAIARHVERARLLVP